jgi:hypothetical protein
MAPIISRVQADAMPRDAPSKPEPAVLAAGKMFHDQVQGAYVAQLVGLEPKEVIEHTIIRPSGRRERADLLHFVTDSAERQLVVIEIKSTRWDHRESVNRRRLFRRYLLQMEGYLDILIERIGDTADSVVAAMLYPSRPTDEAVAAELDAVALSRGVMLVYYDDMDWAKKNSTRGVFLAPAERREL